jgi:ATP-dependent Clp protease ATP-binding subunit ClpB
MTSNLGSHLIQEQLEHVSDEEVENVMGELRYKLIELLRKTIRPEFLNRIDEVVLFKPLTRKELRKIVDIQIDKITAMVKGRDITIEVDDEAKDWLAKLGYDVTYGARPLKRTIQKYLINPLSQELLAGNFVNGDTILITQSSNAGLDFRKKNN